MGSVPAISVLILGIVVPALAGYIEVCDLKCLVVYSVPGQSDLDQKHQCDLIMEKKTNLFGLYSVLSLSLSLQSSHEAFMAQLSQRLHCFISLHVTVIFLLCSDLLLPKQDPLISNGTDQVYFS